MDWNKSKNELRKLGKYLWVHTEEFPMDILIGHKDSHGLFHYKGKVKLVRWDTHATGEKWKPIQFKEFVTLTAPRNSVNWNTKTAIARHFIRLSDI